MSLRVPQRPANPVGFLCALTVLLVIAALLSPPLLMSSSGRARAKSRVNTTSAPVSAPAEPFILGAASSLGGSLTVREGLITGLISFLREPFLGLLPASMPDAFAAAKPPTMTEKLASSLLGFFIAGTKKGNAGLTEPLPPLPPPPYPNIKYDFDGDGKADVGRWHSENTELKVKKSGSSGYLTYTVGTSSAKAAPGDYDGDGDTDAGTFYSGSWKYKTTVSGSETSETWGTSGDIPVPGNYDGNAQTDYAVFRPSDSTWRIKKRPSGTESTTSYGSSGDIPVPGDFDGDGTTDIAVFRPSTGYWYIQKSSGGSITQQWGLAIDIPLQGDFDGDGKSDMAVYRPSTGVWYALESGGTYPDAIQQTWGNYGDQPAPADYDGDGRTDFCVWRPTTGVWYTYLNDPSSEESQYLTETLGVPGDTAVPSAYTKQIAGTATGNEIAAARLNPKNATGGTNLYSQNFGWGTSLVGLPGRSGLNAGFGMSYNSLVWTKIGSAMYFDADKSNITPGFRFGFPEIEPVYYDTEKSLWAYMMVTPGGGRTQFRQTAASATFETADSSYTQLVTNNGSNPNAPVEETTITVKTTDGTQMAFVWNTGAYRCTQIKDRNGNYITIGYNSYGQMLTVTDTLGRVINIAYNEDGQPTTITQTWKTTNGQGSGTTTHTWASFTYTTHTVDTNFDSSITAIVGPPDTTVIKVLQKVTYADGSYTKFHYNDYLQVKQIENFADDDNELNRVRTNLDSISGTRSDCPRFTHTYTRAENFNLSGSTPQEIDVENLAPASSSFTAHGGSETTAMVKVTMASHPDSLYNKIHFGASGYKEGLAIATEDCTDTNCTGTGRKRWTWNDFTQDNTGVSYIMNPRVVESRVGDGTNTKKTTISYYSSGGAYPYGLPEIIKVGDTTTVLKTQKTVYNLSSDYTSRRIIGLPSESYVYEGTDTSGTMMSKVTYAYDEGSDASLSSATQHDTTNYGTGLNYRGNLTKTRRWDVTVPTTENASVYSTVAYNIAGSPVSQTDARGRVSTISYTDDWNDNPSPNRTTYAYPTTMTDPNSQSSTVKYRYDIGANVEANSPAPAGNSYGKKTKRTYDSKGRLEKDAVWTYTGGQWKEYSYVRKEFPDNGIYSKIYAPIINADGDDNLTEDEVLTESWSDGAGRVRLSRTPHTFDSNGAAVSWAGTQVEYDILGRVKRQSVPTEVATAPNISTPSEWAASGDDYTSGWLWTYQKYDWKGRVVRKINTDGVDQSSLNDSDVVISYEGCGCAGGQITTIEGENIIETDWSGGSPTTLGRRKQKAYEDILGRVFKTEVMQWNGTDVYMTTETEFNGRDQALTVTQTDHNESVAQVTSMGYDGHGRLAQRHIPQQDANTATTYVYHADDSVYRVTDARNVITQYTYNNRGLVTDIGHVLPEESEIPATAAVGFEYDSLGNRTEMTDGLGTVEYEYNSLSQMTAETRDFSDTIPNSPISGGKFKLEYTYALSGQLKSLKDPYGDQINYAHDKAGRLNTVTGTSFGGVTSYANTPHYRAWGGLQSLSYGNTTAMSVTFNNRLQASHSELIKSGQSTPVMSKDYSYYADGSMRKLDDLVDERFDRLNTYDNLGRPTTGKSGLEARGGTPTGAQLWDLPYRQSYEFNAFGNLTARNHLSWGFSNYNIARTYENNRVTHVQWEYDADGRETRGMDWFDVLESTYDAAGQLTKYHRFIAPEGESEVLRYYNGDGREEKRQERHYEEVQPDEWEWRDDEPVYYVRSTVLGGEVVSETTSTGQKKRTFVRAAGTELAWQNGTGESAAVIFQNWDASGNGYRTANSSGTVSGSHSREGAPGELDPLGGNIGTFNGVTEVPGNYCVGCEIQSPQMSMFVNGKSVRYSLDGMPVSIDLANSQMASGMAVQCPDGNCGPVVMDLKAPITGSHRILTGPFQAFADGSSGYSINSWDMGVYLGVLTEAGIMGPADWAMNFASQESGPKRRRKKKRNSKPPVGGPTENKEAAGYIGYLSDEGDTVQRIKDIVAYAVSQEACTKAFQAIGATAINDQLNNITIVTQSVFNEPLYDRNWNRGSDIGKAMRNSFKENQGAADHSWPGLYENSGWRFMGLSNSGIQGIVGGDKEHFSVIVVHAFAHTGGKEGRGSQTWGEWLNRETPHDLRYLGKEYKNIIEACTRERKSNLLWGQ